MVRWLVTLFVFLLTLGLLGLSAWQWQRGKEKQYLFDQYQQNWKISNPPPVQVDKMPTLYEAVQVVGRAISDKQWLLENKFHHHQLGYQVLTAVEVSPGAPWVLVNRGWIPRASTSPYIPAIPPTQTEVSWRGLAYFSDRQLLLLGDFDSSSGWPRPIPRLDYAELERQIGHPLRHFVVLLAPSENGGFVREWQPESFSPSRHRGYAVQWLLLALALNVAYGCLIWKKRNA
jgi:surfeit locus 1 family protein